MKKSQKLPKLKNYTLFVSEHFPTYHSRKGEPTNFIEKIKSGEKIHTLRANFDWWKRRIEAIRNHEGYLSFRGWEGIPYKSKQVEN